MLTIKGIDHVVLRVQDLEAMRRLYCDVFGAEGNGVSIYLADPEGNTAELKGAGAGGAKPLAGS